MLARLTLVLSSSTRYNACTVRCSEHRQDNLTVDGPDYCLGTFLLSRYRRGVTDEYPGRRVFLLYHPPFDRRPQTKPSTTGRHFAQV